MTASVGQPSLLEGSVAIVTGGSSGLGRASAEALSQMGAHVLLVARGAERLEATAKTITDNGGTASWLAVDASSPEGCARVAAHAAELGTVRVLVNSAGIGSAVPASRETPDEFRRVIDVNLNGTYWMCQRIAGVMASGGSIVNVSSVLGLVSVGLPQAAYATSKAGLLGLTRDLAVQWATRRRIRVNAICPATSLPRCSTNCATAYWTRSWPASRSGESEAPRKLPTSWRSWRAIIPATSREPRWLSTAV